MINYRNVKTSTQAEGNIIVLTRTVWLLLVPFRIMYIGPTHKVMQLNDH